MYSIQEPICLGVRSAVDSLCRRKCVRCGRPCVAAAHCVYDYNGPMPATLFAVALGKVLSGWDSNEVEHVHKSNVSS